MEKNNFKISRIEYMLNIFFEQINFNEINVIVQPYNSNKKKIDINGNLNNLVIISVFLILKAVVYFLSINKTKDKKIIYENKKIIEQIKKFKFQYIETDMPKLKSFAENEKSIKKMVQHLHSGFHKIQNSEKKKLFPDEKINNAYAIKFSKISIKGIDKNTLDKLGIGIGFDLNWDKNHKEFIIKLYKIADKHK